MKSATFVFEKGKTDGILNGVWFFLWNFFILLISPTTKAVNDSYINMTLLNNVEKVF